MIFRDANLPLVVQVGAHGTGVGKTTSAWRLRDHLDKLGIENRMGRIETRGVHRLRSTDVSIAVEDFVDAPNRTGAVAGVLRPLSQAVIETANTRSVLIVDWAGGTANIDAQYLAVTRFGDMLAQMRITGLSLTVATNKLDHMRQAADHLRMLARVAPRVHRGLILNERFGKFTGGTANAAAYADMVAAAGQDPTIVTLPAVQGDCWKLAEDAGLTMPAMLACTPAEFGEIVDLDLLSASACLTEVASFWLASRRELERVFRFRGPARPPRVRAQAESAQDRASTA